MLTEDNHTNKTVDEIHSCLLQEISKEFCWSITQKVKCANNDNQANNISINIISFCFKKKYTYRITVQLEIKTGHLGAAWSHSCGVFLLFFCSTEINIWQCRFIFFVLTEKTRHLEHKRTEIETKIKVFLAQIKSPKWAYFIRNKSWVELCMCWAFDPICLHRNRPLYGPVIWVKARHTGLVK